MRGCSKNFPSLKSPKSSFHTIKVVLIEKENNKNKITDYT